MAILGTNRIQSKTDTQVASESVPGSRLDSSYYRFSRTDFALNNLFLFDDSISGGDKPLFYLRGTFPWTKLEVFNHHSGNSFEYFPDTEDVDQFEIEFYETSDSRVFDYFQDWWDLIHNDNGTFNLPATFKKDLSVYRVEAKTGDSDSGLKKVFGFKYENVFPVSISDWSPDYSDNNVVIFTVRFSADNVTRLTAEQGIQVPYVPDATALWSAAKSNADWDIGAARSNINEQKSDREIINEKLSLKKKMISEVSKQFDIPERTVSTLTTKTTTAALNLYFSKGRNFTNLGV